jgi:signal peptidase II
MRMHRGHLLLAFALLILDRALKAVALGLPTDGRVWLLPRALSFELFRNDGIAFSLPFSGPLVWLLSLAVLAVVAWAAVRDFRGGEAVGFEAYAFFALGACSNLFDRVAYGFTVDYLIFFGRSAVNLADAMIVAGALWLLRSGRRSIRRT